MKLLIWQDEVNGKYRCRQVSSREEIYKLGLMALWQNESSDNYVIKSLADAESIFENPEEELRELSDGDVDLETVNFDKQSIYISSSECFVTDKYLTFYTHDNKVTALVEVKDSVEIDELTQQDLFELARSA